MYGPNTILQVSIGVSIPSWYFVQLWCAYKLESWSEYLSCHFQTFFSCFQMFLTNNELKRLKNYYLRVDCQKAHSVVQKCSMKCFWDHSKMTSHKFDFFPFPLCHTKMTVKVTTLYIMLQKNYPNPPTPHPLLA